MPLTADDTRAIADKLLEVAQAIDAYLDESFRTISRPDYDAISESAKTLLRVSATLTTAAVGLSIDQMQAEADELKRVIAAAKEKLAQLQSVGKVIRLTADVADLATAVAARDPAAACKSVEALREAISSG